MKLRTLVVTVVMVLTAGPLFAQLASEQDQREALRLYRVGQEFLSAEQFERAADAFRKALEKDRLLTLAHYGLGQSNMALKRYPSAVQAFTGCREAYQELSSLSAKHHFEIDRRRDEEIRELRDSIRRIQSGQIPVGNAPNSAELRTARLEQRISDLERARQRKGQAFEPPAEVSLALGSAHFRNGQLEDAEREWKAAVTVNPKLGEAHNNLAVVYMMTGRLNEADEAVKLAEKVGFRVDPRFKEDLKARRRSG